MNSSSILYRFAQFLCAAGVALHLYTVIFQAEGRFSFFLGGLFLWSCAPYCVSLILLLLARKPVLAIGYGATSLGFDIYTFVTVFVRPSSSTAALGLLAMPFWNLVLFGPVGAFIAWVIFKTYSHRHNGEKGDALP